jgi:GAF domain-containing protein
VVRTALESASTPEERSLRALQLVCESRAADGGHFFTLAGDGVRLAASHGLPIAPESLAALVCEHLARERDSSETLTMMATSALPDGPADFRVTAQADGIRYELLVLACKIKEQGEVLGVMAVASRDTRVRDPKQAQLLVAIAQHLLRANDADASRL